jgi:hypothetical protein
MSLDEPVEAGNLGAAPAGVGATPRQARRPSRVTRLYHLAEADNLDSILNHGLLSTERLLERAGLPDAERAEAMRRHRAVPVCLPTGTLIRDQAPMPPSALASALDDGMEPGDWYALLNSHVFLWPDRERLERQRKACGIRLQFMLTFDATALLARFGEHAFVSPINSGNARRKPARRGRGTLLAYHSWDRAGWPTGQRTRPPAEFLFSCAVPVAAPYLLAVEEI